MNEPISPTTPLGVTLEAQEWNAVIDVFATGPWRVVNPIMQKLMQQIQGAAAQFSEGRTAPMLNGTSPNLPGG